MPKIVKCPVYHGTVTFVDPMLTTHALAWERALKEVQNAGDITRTELDRIMLPAIFTNIEAWNVAMPGMVEVDAEHFPASPREKVSELVSWLIGQISQIYTGTAEVDDPNA